MINFRSILYAIAVLLLTVLNSCGIYTNYQRRESLPTDSIYRDLPINEVDTTSIASISWKEFFSDTILVSWIEAGLENNTDLAIANLRTESARASLWAAKMSFLPSASLTVDGSINKIEGNDAVKAYSLGGEAKWEIDVFGALRNSKKASYSEYMRTLAYAQAVKTQLIATIADTYYTLISLDKKLEIVNSSIDNWRKNVSVMESMKKAGMQNEAAVAQSKASLLEVEISAVDILRTIHELENAFSSLLGIVPQSIRRSDLFDFDFDLSYGYGVPLLLLNQRPDVMQAEWNLSKCFYCTNKARSAFYPQIVLDGSAVWTKEGANPANWIFSTVGSLVQPLFNRGVNKANLKIAENEQKEALLSFSQKLLDAGTEVNDAVHKYQLIKQTISLDTKRIESLRQAVNATSKTMTYGTTTYLEVLIAQQSLLQGELALIDDKRLQIQSVIELYHALGGGIK